MTQLLEALHASLPAAEQRSAATAAAALPSAPGSESDEESEHPPPPASPRGGFTLFGRRPSSSGARGAPSPSPAAAAAVPPAAANAVTTPGTGALRSAGSRESSRGRDDAPPDSSPAAAATAPIENPIAASPGIHSQLLSGLADVATGDCGESGTPVGRAPGGSMPAEALRPTEGAAPTPDDATNETVAVFRAVTGADPAVATTFVTAFLEASRSLRDRSEMVDEMIACYFDQRAQPASADANAVPTAAPTAAPAAANAAVVAAHRPADMGGGSSHAAAVEATSGAGSCTGDGESSRSGVAVGPERVRPGLPEADEVAAFMEVTGAKRAVALPKISECRASGRSMLSEYIASWYEDCSGSSRSQSQ